MKNNLQSLNLENLKNIVVGSTFFGGGGGGSREEGDALVELMKEEGGSGLEIPLVQVSQMETKKAKLFLRWWQRSAPRLPRREKPLWMKRKTQWKV